MSFFVKGSGPEPGRPGSRFGAGPLLAGCAVAGAWLCVGLVLTAGSLYASGGRRTVPAHGAGLRGNVGNRTPGYLGIGFRELTEDQVSSVKGQGGRGVEVVQVDHDGPAGQAGLHAQDIIVALNGQAIAGAIALKRMIHDAGAGVQVALTVVRGGKPMTLNAQLGSRDEVAKTAWAKLNSADNERDPVLPESSHVFHFAEPSRVDPDPEPVPVPPAPDTSRTHLFGMLHGTPLTGMVLETMEPQLATYFGAPKGLGLLVHSVIAGTPAAESGLHAGDVVLRADMYALRNVNDWTKRVHAAKGHPITLDVIRQRQELTLTLQPETKRHSLLEWPSVF